MNKGHRLKETSKNEIPGNLVVVERKSNLRFSPVLALYENIKNVSLIRKYKPEAVFSFDHLMSIFACIYCKLKGIKFVFVVVDDFSEIEKVSFLKNILWKYAAKPILYSLSYAVSSTSYKLFEFSKKYNKKAYYIPNGKPMEFVLSAEAVKQKPEKCVNLVCSLREWYDFDLLFDVFKEFPELTLNIYGIGKLYDDLCEKSKFVSNINIKGNIGSEMLPKLIAETLFGIIPLKLNKLNDAACPIKLFDYWSAKKAVIASPTYELSNIGKGAIIFASDKAEYVKAINSLINDDSLMNCLAEKGYNNIINNYNYDILSLNYENIIK